MLTCPCNVDPLTPHFYIVKLGFTGVYIIFLFLLTGAVLMCTHDLCFEHKKKNQLKFVIYNCKNRGILHRRVFVIPATHADRNKCLN